MGRSHTLVVETEACSSFFPRYAADSVSPAPSKRGVSNLPVMEPPRPPGVCRVCGASIRFGRSYCASCAVAVSREGLIEAAKLGRVAGHSPEARAKQAEKQRRHVATLKAWNPSDQPDWLTEQVYREKIQ